MTDLPALSDLFWLGRYQQQARDRDRHRAEYPTGLPWLDPRPEQVKR